MSAWSQDELRKIAKTATFKGLLESGQLTPIVGRTFPLGEAAAMRRLHVVAVRASTVD